MGFFFTDVPFPFMPTLNLCLQLEKDTRCRQQCKCYMVSPSIYSYPINTTL
jgi:hypothetical protein